MSNYTTTSTMPKSDDDPVAAAKQLLRSDPDT